jgi:hypothetical protein
MPPEKIVYKGSTASPEGAADRTSATPTTTDKDLIMKHHGHAPSNNRGGRKRSATHQDNSTRTLNQRILPSQQLTTLQSDHTNTRSAPHGEKACIISTHPKPAHSNVAMVLSNHAICSATIHIISLRREHRARPTPYEKIRAKSISTTQYPRFQNDTGLLASCR